MHRAPIEWNKTIIVAAFFAACCLCTGGSAEAKDFQAQAPALKSVTAFHSIQAIQEWDDSMGMTSKSRTSTGKRPLSGYAIVGGLALVFLLILVFAMKKYSRS